MRKGVRGLPAGRKDVFTSLKKNESSIEISRCKK